MDNEIDRGYSYEEIIELCSNEIDSAKRSVDLHVQKGTLFTPQGQEAVERLRTASASKWALIQTKFHMTGIMRMNSVIPEE